VLRWMDTNNWYKAYLDGASLVLQKKVNGTTTTIASVAFTATAGASYNIRFRAVGTTLTVKAWAAGTTEPTAWTITAADSTFTTGNCGLRMQLATGVVVTYTSFRATYQ